MHEITMKALLMVVLVFHIIGTYKLQIEATNEIRQGNKDALEKVSEATDYCLFRLNNFEKKDIEDVQQGKWISDDDHYVKSFYYCYLRQMGVVTDQYRIKKNVSIRLLTWLGNEKEKSKEAVEACHKPNEDGDRIVIDEMLEESIKRSKKQSDVDDTVLKLAQNGQWLENKNLKTFYFYYLMDIGILLPDLGPNNIINRQRAKEYLEFLGNDNRQRVKEVVDRCDPGTKVSPSDRPFQFCKCLQQHGMPIDVLKKE